MTHEFEDMLRLLGAGARGYEVSAAQMDMEAVRACAILQGVWPIVYKAAEKTADVSRWRNEFITAVAKSVTRKEFTLSIIKKLEENGIICCLMKGAVVADLYAQPECRISGDTDIYINPADEYKAVTFLKENGYDVEKRAKNDHHVKARHPVGGLLELHVRLYSKTSENIVFGGHITYSDKYEKVLINGNVFHVMTPDDELMYLTAHYIKHLVNGGCGIRQVMDLLLYIEKNRDKIDFEKYNETLRKLRYDKLINVLKSVGTTYFGYDYPMCDKILMDKLLTDMEKGGTFGYLADDRTNFIDIYCAKRASSKTQQFVYSKISSEKNIFFKLFPPKWYLAKAGYGYAKNSLLIPFAWFNRLFNIAVRRIKSYDENKMAAEKSNKRLEIMKELGMID